MDSIPNEMLTEILLNLKLNDLRCARLVCKRFYDVSTSSAFVDREKLVYCGRTRVNKIWPDKFKHFVKSLDKTERSFYHYSFVNIRITDEFEQIARERGSSMRSLEFTECYIADHKRLWECLSRYCRQLKSLVWAECGGRPFIAHFVNYLFSSDPTGGEVFDIPIPSFPSLEYIQTEPCRISHEPLADTFARLAPNVRNYYLDDDRYYPFEDIRDYLSFKATEIRRISLKTYMPFDANLIEIADINFRDLREVSFYFNAHIDERSVMYFIERQVNVREFKIQRGRNISNDTLRTIGRCLKNLQVLYVADNNHITFTGLVDVVKRTPLRSLHAYPSRSSLPLLVPVDSTTGNVLINYRLKELNLCGSTLTRQQVTYIAFSFRGLIRLHLPNCTVGLTDIELQLICRYLSNLELLDISGGYQLTDVGFGECDDPNSVSFGDSFKNLAELTLDYCHQISDITVEKHLKLPSLRTLNLNDCNGLTVNSFIALPANCPSLEILNMKGININIDTLKSTIISFKRLRMITVNVDATNTKYLLKALFERRVMQSLYERTKFLKEVSMNNTLFVRCLDDKQFCKYRT